MTVRAVVFDMDGVLVDSEEIWDEIRRGLAADAGRPWPDDATRAMQGMSTAEWSAYLTGTVGVPGEPAEVARQVIDAMARRYRERLPLLPGAVAAVERLAGAFTLGLASSSPRSLIDAVLDAAGLTALFRATVSSEEVAAGKPAPDVYAEALRRLDVDAAAAVAIEDSTNGLRAAAAAGMGVVAVPHDAFPPAGEALALAGAVVGSLDEVTPELVRRSR